MSEYILNGNFDSNLTEWTQSGGDVNWTWDATGAEHAGGSAKAVHTGAVLTTLRHRMYDSVAIANTANITTAVMDMWTQWQDSEPAYSAVVETCTVKFWLQLESPGGTFYTIASSTKNYNVLASEQLALDVSVKTELQAGGDGTWNVWVVCDIYRGDVTTGVLAWLVAWVDDLSLDIKYAFTNTSTGTLSISGTATVGVATDYDATGTVSISGSLTEAYTMVAAGTGVLTISGSSISLLGAVSTHAGTLALSGVSEGSQSIRTDIEMFLGSGSGKVYAYSPSHLSDDGVAIGSIWQSKQTDLSDQHPEVADTWKNLWKVRLIYIDKTADTNVTVYVSTDGGTTWSSQMKTLGTGDETTKSADFYFMKTFEFLDVKIEHSSAANEFQWAGVYIYWTPAGEHFSI
uniref:Uncharacterized protein n=2 Tax=viral metagenome TaxID=1070528 RepID=A0A6M3ITE9_9ZZZZ